jgi:hypothetical protein
MLTMNGRRTVKDEEGISFKTPDGWLVDPGVRLAYEKMVFDRNLRGQDAAKRVMGVGHKVIDQAIKQALDGTANVATVSAARLKQPLLVFRVFDSVTSERTSIRSKIVGMAHSKDGLRILQDWELLLELNGVVLGRDAKADSSVPPDNVEEIHEIVASGISLVSASTADLDVPFKHPVVELLSLLWQV